MHGVDIPELTDIPVIEKRTLTASETVGEAIRIIDEEGWVQRAWRSNDGYCVLGALSEVNYRFKNGYDHERVINNALRENLPNRKIGLLRRQKFYGVVEFNDYEGRTKEEVIAFMNAAQRQLEKAGL